MANESLRFENARRKYNFRFRLPNTKQRGFDVYVCSTLVKMSRFVVKDDEHKAREIDKGCKESWTYKWDDVVVEKKDKLSQLVAEYRIGDYFQKLVAGMAMYTLQCNQKLRKKGSDSSERTFEN